jgi:hypothetical protein
MRWGLLASFVTISGAACLAYACSNDTFTGDDGGDGTSATDAQPETSPQADFCDAEATYLAKCKVDAACAYANLSSCGQLYADLNPVLTAAVTACIELDQLGCKFELSDILTSACVQSQLSGYVNDGGAITQLGIDFCKACDPASPASCEAKFAAAIDQPGYLPSMFTNPIITQIDIGCAKKLDGGPVIVGDASIDCLNQFLLCEVLTFQTQIPKDNCVDGGL